jgi:hypothetical protein
VVTRAVEAFLRCGIAHFGFARLRCQGCGRNRFLAYSCRTRQLCPSCAAKRVAAFTDWVASEVLEPVSHRQVVFTIPKVLRPVFRKNRKLLGLLCRSAWETLKEMHQGAFPEEDVRGAAVIAVHTTGDQLQWHPHLHALVPDAVWTREGRRLSISYLDPEAMTRIFQGKVLAVLVQERCLSPEFAARLLAWRHSGFQVYRAESVEPDNTPALERLCAYIGRAVFASSRVEYDPSTGGVRYRTAKGAQLSLDALEWIALVTQHVPDPGEHTRHYFGHYSNAARGKRRQRGARDPATDPPAGGGDSETEDFRRECRRSSRPADSKSVRGRPPGLPRLRWPAGGRRLHRRSTNHPQNPGASWTLGTVGASSSGAARPRQDRCLELALERQPPRSDRKRRWGFRRRRPDLCQMSFSGKNERQPKGGKQARESPEWQSCARSRACFPPFGCLSFNRVPTPLLFPSLFRLSGSRLSPVRPLGTPEPA